MRKPQGIDKKVRVSLTIDGDVLETLKVMAVEDDRTVSQLVNRLLKKQVMGTPSRKQKV